MAGSTDSVATVLGEISRDHLECSICHERYDTPKILSCLHSFCEKCLLIYQKTLQEPSMIKCPTCRFNSELPSDGIPGLKTNFHLKEIVEDFALKEKLTQKEGFKLLCELCEDQREAQSRCMDCSLFLCTKCLGAHRRIAADHEVIALDSLRSGSVAHTKSKIERPCEKHRGEKKRFFCETCDKLICRDCTVVEHRAHKFTTVDDAAVRFRETTKELMTKMGESLSAIQSKVDEKSKIENVDTSSTTAQEQVIHRAELESSKISQLESNILHDISRREDRRLKTIKAHGYTPTEPSSGYYQHEPLENEEKYCEKTEEVLKNIDSRLQDLNQTIQQLQQANSGVSSQLINLRDNTQQEAVSQQSEVKDRKEELLMQIGITTKDRKNLDKLTSTHIHRMRHTLEIAGDLIQSASDVDFLSLHSMIDADLKSLIEQSPLIHPGYPKIEFKSRDGTRLGDVIGVPGATWKMTREIEIKGSLGYGGHGGYNTSAIYAQAQAFTRITIISMCAFRNDEMLVGCREIQAVLVYNTAGTCTKQLKTSGLTAYKFKVAAFPDGSFITVHTNYLAYLYPPNASRHSVFIIPTFHSISHYADKQIIAGHNPERKVTILHSSNGSVSGQVPVTIQPDFLASTSTGRILVAARSPAIVQGLDRNETIILTIHPTVEGAPDRKQVTCGGICCDSRDYIYVAVSVEGRPQVHVHQYSPYGSFIGCLTCDIQQPITDIAMTGDDTLVVAEQYKLKLFQLDK